MNTQPQLPYENIDGDNGSPVAAGCTVLAAFAFFLIGFAMLIPVFVAVAK